MGLKDLFGGKNRAAEQERILEEQKEKEHQDRVDAQKKAHEGEPWPSVPRLNILNIKDSKNEVEDPLTKERKDEVGALVFEPDLAPEQVSGLSLQELLFLQLTMTMFNRKAALLNYEKNHRVVYNEFLGRIHKAEKVYVLYDKRTSYPLIDGGFVPVYLDKEHADKAVELYKAQFRDVAVIERSGEEAPVNENGQKPIALFDYLYYIGAENIVVDNGWYKGIVRRSEISVPMDWNSDPKKTPPSNPALAFAMTDYVSEMRWPVKYDKRAEIIRKKTDRMMALIPTGRYIIPSRVSEVSPEQLEKLGADAQKMAKQVQFPAVKVNEKMYLPIFTDLFEYSKKFAKTDMRPVGFEYKNLLRFVAGGIEGIIINPNGQGIVVPKDKATELLFKAAGIKPAPAKEASDKKEEEQPAENVPTENAPAGVPTEKAPAGESKEQTEGADAGDDKKE